MATLVDDANRPGVERAPVEAFWAETLAAGALEMVVFESCAFERGGLGCGFALVAPSPPSEAPGGNVTTGGANTSLVSAMMVARGIGFGGGAIGSRDVARLYKRATPGLASSTNAECVVICVGGLGN